MSDVVTPVVTERLELEWTGRNRREMIRFLGDRWRGFSGQWTSKDGYAACTVQFRGHGPVESASVGQTVVIHANGDLKAYDRA